jgi:hypothetical protein
MNPAAAARPTTAESTAARSIRTLCSSRPILRMAASSLTAERPPLPVSGAMEEGRRRCEERLTGWVRTVARQRGRERRSDGEMDVRTRRRAEVGAGARAAETNWDAFKNRRRFERLGTPMAGSPEHTPLPPFNFCMHKCMVPYSLKTICMVPYSLKKICMVPYFHCMPPWNLESFYFIIFYQQNKI